MAIVFVSADSFVKLVFGMDWLVIIPIIKVFSISAMMMSLNALLGSVITSMGKSELIVKDALLKKSLILIGILIGINWGILGVAIGKMTADVLSVGITFYHAKKAVGLSIYSQLKNVIDILSITIIISVIVIIVRNFILIERPIFDAFIFSCFFIAIYIAFFFLFKKKELDRIAILFRTYIIKK